MEYMNGKMDGFIKEILIMIFEMVMANYMQEKYYNTKAIGKMVNGLIEK